jgi:hypothetical protein
MTNPEERASLFDPPPSGSQPPKKGGNGGGGKRGMVTGLIIGAVVLVVLCIAGVAAAIFLGGPQVAEVVEQRASSIPAIVGSDTQVYGSITPALSDIPNVARLQEAYPELFIEEDPEAANEQLEEIGLNFEEDIQPWLGAEASFAIGGIEDYEALGQALDQEDFEATSEQVDMMAIIASRDNEAAAAFLDKLMTNLEDEGFAVSEETYNEVTIYEGTEDEASFYAALAQGNVVFANNSRSIEGIIDRDPEGSDNLASSDRFQNLRASQPENAIGYIYIDGAMFSEISNQMRDQIEADMGPDMTEQLEQQLAALEAFQAIGLSISVESEGVAFDTTLNMDLDELDEDIQEMIESSSEPVSADRVDAISEDALTFITFRIPGTFKESFMQGFNAQPGAEEARADLEQQLGLDLEEDFLDWFVGAGSLVILPGEMAGDIQLPATGYFAFDSENQDAAESAMENIAEVFEMNVGLMFESEEIGGADWQVIQNPGTGDVLGGYTFIEGELFIAIGSSAVASASGDIPGPISETSAFEAVYNNLPVPNSGYFYINLEEVTSLAEDMGATADPDAEEVINNLESVPAIGAASQPGLDEEGVNRSRLFFYISGSGSDEE